MDMVNYNTSLYSGLKEVWKWHEDNGITPRIFDSYDGGGFTGYIVEFQTRYEVKKFVKAFPSAGRPWAEDAEGKHHPFK